MGAGELDHFSGFAGAAEEFLVLFAAAAKHRLYDFNAEGFDEFAEFVEQGLGFRRLVRLEIEAHQQGALDHVRLFSDFKHPRHR